MQLVGARSKLHYIVLKEPIKQLMFPGNTRAPYLTSITLTLEHLCHLSLPGLEYVLWHIEFADDIRFIRYISTQHNSTQTKSSLVLSISYFIVTKCC